jgi:SAM-dependent methyltransferase
MPSSGPVNLVDRSFWEQDYFGGERVPSRPDCSLPFERCLARALVRHAPVSRGATVLEAGCAPGKWLVFYAERFGARVVGIEYSPHGAELARANLRECGVDGAILEADFFAEEARPVDLVLSLGFVEHFDDLETVFACHLDWVAPGGRLVIGVPNYRGVNRLVQLWADPAHLALHNLDAMRPAWYYAMADRHGLDLEHLCYLGGFDPIIIKVTRRSAFLWTVVEGRYRRLHAADRIDHPLLSSYLLGVFRRAR